MTIRTATVFDIPSLFALSASIHANEYSQWVPAERQADFARRYADTEQNRSTFERVLRSRLKSPKWTITVAVHEAAVIGFIAVRTDDEESVLRSIFVDGAARADGVGSALLQSVLGPRTLRLNVAKPNERARRFYRKFGFRDAGEAGSFFGIPLIAMRREID